MTVGAKKAACKDKLERLIYLWYSFDSFVYMNLQSTSMHECTLITGEEQFD